VSSKTVRTLELELLMELEDIEELDCVELEEL
jgi:hypothetical protein